ncbi:MAG: hypothetical protein ABSG14_14230 [Verrucomicrobiia bacterium]|jgi:hypothetical protein
MNRLLKLGLVLAGYAAALLVTCAAFYVRGLLMRPDTSQASAGMQAFADLILFVGMFGFLSLAPTALALYFLRSHVRFWTLFSILCLAFAFTGPVAAVLIKPSWGAMEIFKIPRILGAPLLCLAFLISAIIAPPCGCRPCALTRRFSKWPLLAAALIEGAVSAYAFLCLFVFHHWLL